MTLLKALADATKHVLIDDTAEERGGFLLNREADYQFVPIRNANEGTDIAPVLYTADQYEFGRIICPLFKDGWKSYGSFHSHPRFSANPSHTDLTRLFRGFKRNFIFSCTDVTLGIYDWEGGALNGKIINWKK